LLRYGCAFAECCCNFDGAVHMSVLYGIFEICSTGRT
jgi:hypothetical protein